MAKKLKDNLELIIWISGFVILFLFGNEQSNFTVCPLKNLGLWCPGCGLGNSIYHLFHLNFLDSIRAHPLGILGFIIISFRIFQLTIINYRRKNNG